MIKTCLKAPWKFLIIAALMTPILSGCQQLAPGMTIETRCKNRYVASKPLGCIPIYEITPELVYDMQCQQNELFSYQELYQLHDRYEYRIGPHDRLLISIWGHPELNHPSHSEVLPETMTYVVTGAGTVYFPYVGEIEVAGMTIDQVRERLRDALTSIVKNPAVTLQVTEFRSQSINVVGEVNLPAFIHLEDVPLTPIDAIGKAGGATPMGDLQHTVLTRDGQFYELNILPSFRYGGLSSLQLKHGDILYVPSRLNNQVYVIGEVLLPQSIFFDSDGLTLSDVIARSAGLDPFASNPELVFVFREELNGEKVAYHLDATSPAALLLANQFELRRQDIVYVGPYRPALLNRIMTNFLSTTRAAADVARTAGYINDVINRFNTFDDGGSD